MRDRTNSVKGHPVETVPPGGTNVLFDVWLVSRATHAVLDAALVGTGLNADEFAIYSVLTSADTHTPSELAQWMSAPTTTVSSYIKRFEGRGHVQREPNPDDGRSYVLRLTAAGRRVHRSAVDAFAPVLHRVVEDLGTREPAVRRALTSLRETLDTAERRRAIHPQ